jgi:hypothetical protein
MNTKFAVVACVGLCCVALGILPGCIWDPEQRTEAHDTALIEKNMAIVGGMGVVRSIKPELHEVQVDPLVWASIDFESKKYVATTLAQFCGWKSGESDWVELIDAMTGKLLAKCGSDGYQPGP